MKKGFFNNKKAVGLTISFVVHAALLYGLFHARIDLNDLTLAYAVSVHKAQGSEYQAVVMPLMTQHFIMLQRNLFYTALTRAKRLSVIVGSFKALHIAIKNDKPVRRNSMVKDMLIDLSKP